MAGLLDMLDTASKDPATAQGILRFGLSLLQSKGNFGNAVGQAGVAGLQGAQDYRQQQYQKQIQQSQLDQLKRQKELQNLPSQFATPATKLPTQDNADVGQPGEPPVAPASFDFGGYVSALMGKDPIQALQLKAMTEKDTSPLKIGKDDRLVDRKDPSRIILDALPDQAKIPSAIQEYEYAKRQGYGGSFQQFQLEGRRAGAAQTNVKVENQLGQGLAKEVGPMVADSATAAKGAQQQISTSDSLIKAVDSNKIYTGPGATLRLKGAQLGQTLGIAGKDATETIANTRSAIQGLAQSTLAARSALKGQGAVSDFEGRLLDRAASGNVEDLTADEIKQIATVNKRLAEKQIANHRQLLGKLKGRDSTAPLADLFDIPTTEAAPASSGAVRRFNPATGRIE